MQIETKKENKLALAVATIGVVYGDIGTSPLYALKACLSIHGISLNADSILGIVSVFIWSLIFVVSFKYVHLVLKIDKNGEGGILTLSNLSSSVFSDKKKRLAILTGIVGMALFFGDGVITPALSVLSAVEGIAVVDSVFSPYIMPVTILIIAGLFAIQRFGSGAIGQYFGPIMLLWFSTLFYLGVINIVSNPTILKALNPYYGLKFIFDHAFVGISIFGGLVLVLTGAEALYADLGHFGRESISRSWSYIIFPSLTLNYLGQGGLLLHDSSCISHPFYMMAPEWMLHYLVVMATVATIIASQSILSGLFSITSQAVLLNYFPRLHVVNTSETKIGQIYIPTINLFICVLTISAVIHFESSERMAHAYGLCVSGIMLLTTLLTATVAYKVWNWKKTKVCFVFIPLFIVDFLFTIGNLIKFFEGAWYAFLITLFFFYFIHVWRMGNKLLEDQKIVVKMTPKDYIEKHLSIFKERSPGEAIYFCREPHKIPISLVINLDHNKLLHKKVIFVSFVIKEEPYLKSVERFSYDELYPDVGQLVCTFGFKEVPNINKALHWLSINKKIEDQKNISIFISRGAPVITKSKHLSLLSKKVYKFLYSLAQSPIDFYKMPNDRVIELRIRYKI